MRSNNDELENLTNETFPDGIEAELQRREDQKQHDIDYANLSPDALAPAWNRPTASKMLHVPQVEQPEPGQLKWNAIGNTRFTASAAESKWYEIQYGLTGWVWIYKEKTDNILITRQPDYDLASVSLAKQSASKDWQHYTDQPGDRLVVVTESGGLSAEQVKGLLSWLNDWISDSENPIGYQNGSLIATIEKINELVDRSSKQE